MSGNDVSRPSQDRYQIHTFGCKVNTYDSGLLQKRMDSANFQFDKSEGRIHLLNTCAVTAEATREAVKLTRRLKSKDPLATIVVTGCAAQVDTDEFADLPSVDLVVANSHKGDLHNIIRRHFSPEKTEKVHKSNIFRKLDFEAGGGIENSHTRSFLKIQDGCNSFCTYCVIPFGRGRSRSLSVEDLVRRVNELYHTGSREVVLTGVHIGDYKDERGRVLEDLVEAVIAKTKMPRVRLTSLEPVELSERLLDCYQEEKMCAHFHMSIQSAQSKVLQEMRRNYTAKDVEWSLNEIEKRVPGAFVGMDVIVGFAGETDQEFQETVERLSGLPWTRIHVFPYSERPGTKAAMLEDSVAHPEKKRRSKVLREMSQNRYNQQAQLQLGTVKSVLPLNGAQGAKNKVLSADYWPIQLSEDCLGTEPFHVKISEVKECGDHLGQVQLFGERVELS